MLTRTYGDDAPDQHLPNLYPDPDVDVIATGDGGPADVPLLEQAIEFLLPAAAAAFLVGAVCLGLFKLGDWLWFEFGDRLRRRRR